jgi:outer membrane immunogenic protein
MSPAFSADMPIKAMPYAPPAIYDWTGFYVGGNVGYSFGRASSDFTSGGTLSDSTSPSGLIGGGQFGYNWQIGGWVLGAEADFQWSGESADGTVSGGGATIAHTDKLDWFATGRARVGFAYDRWLIYGTGGVAYGAVKSDITLTTPGGSVAFTDSENRLGWVAGAGVENAIWNNWTWKLEYLYMDLGSMSQSTAVSAVIAPPAGATVNQSMHFTDHIVRAGVNYRF